MNKALLVAVVLMSYGSVAAAQYYPYYPYPSSATTRKESEAKGMAEVMRAQGDARVKNSEAYLKEQEARQAELDTKLKTRQTYIELEKMNAAYREEKAAKEKAKRANVDVVKKNPYPALTPSQFDPVTGKIAWTKPLQGKEFDGYRYDIEKAFSELAASGTGDLVDEAIDAIDRMHGELRNYVRIWDTKRYANALEFLGSLKQTAKDLKA